MAIFKCKICGGSLDIQPGESIATCEYCGTKQTLPRLDNEKKANLYDRANHFRRNNDYDKAMGIYETILNEDSTDAEAYWSILLCKYGIEYVEDPSNHKHVPTVNRAQYTSIFDDEDYKSAIQYADSNQREIYEAEANTINDIQKGILDISAKEEPFDVFICYKETDASGRRTKDSVLATELYHELTRDGFKVFFSRITLEDKLGTAYEPYIFAALNSAKVMVVVGTKPEHFNAVWVRNEWSRFLSLIKNGAKKTLIPAYRDMDPYDLPEEFSHLQAQDMSKLGFMQDLIRGIKKIVDSDESKSAVKETVVVNAGNANTASLLKRSFMFLEDGEFDRADEFCEQVLNRDPENAQAYLGKLMAELKVETIDGLVECKEPFEENVNYKKIIRFGDAKLKERLSSIIDSIIERNESDRIENEYQQARISMGKSKTPEDFMAASKLFSQLGSYKDSSELEALCLKKSEEAKLDITYNKANNLCEDNDLFEYKYDSYPAKFAINKTEEAIRLYESILDYKDSAQRVQKCRSAIEDFKIRAEDYRIEQEKMTEAMRIQNEKRTKKIKKILAIAIPILIIAVFLFVLFYQVIIPNSRFEQATQLIENGKYDEALSILNNLSKGNKDEKIVDAINSVNEKITDEKYQTALKQIENGNAVEALKLLMANPEYKDSAKYIRNLVEFLNTRIIANGSQTHALKFDGTMLSTGYNIYQFNIKNCSSLTEISVGGNNTLGLKSDGTVIAAGTHGYNESDIAKWKNVKAVSSGGDFCIALKKDGTVVGAGDNQMGQLNVTKWSEIKEIVSGFSYTAGIRKNGKVVVANKSKYYPLDVSTWTDIVKLYSNMGHDLIGLKSDGTVVATGINGFDQLSVLGWRNIVSISMGSYHTVGLKSDGTVIATGSDYDGKCDVNDWRNIVSVKASISHTVGLKSDGTVVATGNNDYGQCNVDDWKDIIAISAGDSHTVGLKSDGTIVAVGANDSGQCDVNDWKLF